MNGAGPGLAGLGQMGLDLVDYKNDYIMITKMITKMISIGLQRICVCHANDYKRLTKGLQKDYKRISKMITDIMY